MPMERRGGLMEQAERRVTAAGGITVGVAVLLVALSLAQTLYRFSLPTDGWSVSPHPVGGALVVDRHLLGGPAPLRHGDALVSVAGQPVVAIVGNALLLRPRPPAGWVAGHTIIYVVARHGHLLRVALTLRRRPAAALLPLLGGGLLDPVGLLALLIALAVFLLRPGSRAAQLLLLFYACMWAIDTSALPPDLAMWFYRGAFWPQQVFGGAIVLVLAFPLAAHLFLVFPAVARPLRRHPRLTLAALYGIAPACYGGIAAASLAHPLTWGPTGHGLLPYLAMFTPVLVAVGSVGHALITVRAPIPRAQIRWVAFGAFLTIAGMPAFWALTTAGFGLFDPGSLPVTVLGDAVGLALPSCVGIAILRHRLFDIDSLLQRTLVYGALTLAVAGLYVALVGGLGALLQARGNLLVSLLATGVVAALFQPLRAWLQRGVTRLLYGERDEPYAAIARLARRLDAPAAPEAVLATVVETVAQALKLPYAAIALAGAEASMAPTATYGAPVAPPLRLPLAYQGEPVGQLLVSPRAPGDTFGPADRRLLDDLARQAGIAAHAVRLTADLQRSRARLVAAREEERRRLRRDLHDGLGPALAAVTLQAEAAREVLRGDPAGAEALLDALTEQARAAIADIRRLVYDLRPPALDDLGLDGAIRAQAAQLAPSGRRVAVVVEAPEGLPPLPAAVEVAAYRIAQEALANVARHAAAHTCTVRLALDDTRTPQALAVAVTDDGRGLPAERRGGVGLQSMRERAAELGGVCTVTPGAAGGTCVRATLPIVPTEAPDAPGGEP